MDRGIAITFDDGACLDFSPFMHGSHGELRPFRDSLERHDAAATSFVIASPDCRQRLEHEALSGEPMLGEDWWQPAVASSRFEIGNHSWDHNHGVMPGFAPGADGRGSFLPIANAQAAAWEIDQAQDYIARAVGSPPALFAYPYGDVPPFVATQYLPEAASRLGLLGAFTTEGCAVAPTTDPWRIPRVVCGDHWRSPEQFAALLNSLRDNG